jgi:hypothetical protein
MNRIELSKWEQRFRLKVAGIAAPGSAHDLEHSQRVVRTDRAFGGGGNARDSNSWGVAARFGYRAEKQLRSPIGVKQVSSSGAEMPARDRLPGKSAARDFGTPSRPTVPAPTLSPNSRG